MNKVKDTKVIYLTYQLIKEKCEIEDQQYTSFGILLTSVSGDEIIDIAAFKDLTTIKEKAIKFLRILSQNQVKPYEAYEFVEDFLA